MNFIRFREIELWDVKRYFQTNFKTQYKLVSIGNLIKRYKHSITLENDSNYKQITIKLNGQGVALRSEKLGRDIKTKNQYLIKRVNSYILK